MDAARWLAQQSGAAFDFREAAARHGVSHQAVQQAWRRLGLGQTPRERACQQALELARAGKIVTEISRLTGASPRSIRAWCRKRGVPITNGHAADPEAIAAGLDVVRAGGTIAEGASAADVQHAAFKRYMRRAEIRPVHARQGKHNGKGAQAALLVEQEGVTVGEAAKIYGVAPGSVSDYMKKRA